MITSERGIQLIKEHEGLSLEAYRCPAGVWTIGHGSTTNVKPGTRITPREAEIRLREDIREAEKTVDRVGRLVKLEQHQYDALVSLVFNTGAVNFEKSTLRKVILQNPLDGRIEEEWRKWRLVNGKVSAGLVRRRERELQLYKNENE